MVIETFVNEVLSKKNNGCLHKYIRFILYFSKFERVSELLSYFNSEDFPYNATDDNQEKSTLFTGELRCPVCGEIDKVEISEY
uniref:Uncharacterized protein n=1 Tax=Strongyloides venezuelensis TaxID=75913 RepID=A0A0K0FGS4_STRVS